MPSLNELARAHTDLDDEDLGWLHLLLADWQIIADLSFADLVLWLPDRDGQGYWAGAQMRPTMVGSLLQSKFRAGPSAIARAAAIASGLATASI